MIFQTIEFVTKAIGATEPVTTASAIVTGSDPELTNVLLQQLAVALYAFQNKLLTSPLEPSQAAPADPKAGMRPPVAKQAAQDAWVTHIRVETSEDGHAWAVLGEYSTGLLAAQQVVSIPLVPGAALVPAGKMSKAPSLATLPDVRAKYLRITPLKWSGEGKHGPAMRVNLLGPEVSSDSEDPAVAEASGGVVPLRTEAVVEAVKVLLDTLSTLIEAAEFLARREEAQKELKQLEVKKVCANSHVVNDVLICSFHLPPMHDLLMSTNRTWRTWRKTNRP